MLRTHLLAAADCLFEGRSLARESVDFFLQFRDFAGHFIDLALLLLAFCLERIACSLKFIELLLQRRLGILQATNLDLGIRELLGQVLRSLEQRQPAWQVRQLAWAVRRLGSAE